jgi:hypothetical protein
MSAVTLSTALAFALLIAAALAARPGVMRLLVAAAAAIFLGRALLLTHDRATAIGAILLLALCLLLLARGLYERRALSFTPDEQGVLDHLVAGLSQARARHLIDQGLWLSGKAGDVLTREGEPVARLYYLAEGEARVTSGGRQVGVCRAGDLVGELTVLSGERATATVTLDGPARFWCVGADLLRPYVEANEDIRRALEHSFAMALKAKLRASNRVIADAGAGTDAG